MVLRGDRIYIQFGPSGLWVFAAVHRGTLGAAIGADSEPPMQTPTAAAEVASGSGNEASLFESR